MKLKASSFSKVAGFYVWMIHFKQPSMIFFLAKLLSYHPSKHSSWLRRTEHVFSVTFFYYSRRLQEHLANTSWRRLEDVLKMSWKTSWRRFEDLLKTFSEDVLQTRLEDVFKTSCRSFCKASYKHILKTSWRSFQDVLEDKKILRWRRLQDVLETSWRTRNVYLDTSKTCLYKISFLLLNKAYNTLPVDTNIHLHSHFAVRSIQWNHFFL